MKTTQQPYLCDNCGHRFEATAPLQTATNQDVACPKCYTVETGPAPPMKKKLTAADRPEFRRQAAEMMDRLGMTEADLAQSDVILTTNADDFDPTTNVLWDMRLRVVVLAAEHRRGLDRLAPIVEFLARLHDAPENHHAEDLLQLEGNKSAVRPDITCFHCKKTVAMSNDLYRQYMSLDKRPRVCCTRCLPELLKTAKPR